MGKYWKCLKCGSPSIIEVEPMLDGTYGSARCMSDICGREKRVFHLEEQPDGYPPEHRSHKPYDPRRP